jgi:hypothetical protein
VSKEFTRQRFLWLDELMVSVARGDLPQSAFNVGFVLSRHVNMRIPLKSPGHSEMISPGIPE